MIETLDDEGIRNAYCEGFNKTVHMVLADPIGKESKKRERNGFQAIAQEAHNNCLKQVVIEIETFWHAYDIKGLKELKSQVEDK